MAMMITEIQITFSIMMGLMTIVLAFGLPYYCPVSGKVLNRSRKLLAFGTLLLTIHFIIQYFLHKTTVVSAEVRTVVNLFFGGPLSFCFNISLLYLQRNEWLKKLESIFFLLAYFLLLIVLFGTFSIYGFDVEKIHKATVVTSVIYAFTLIFPICLQFKEYHRIVRDIKLRNDYSQELLIRWTKWSMFFMALNGIGLPIMTFNENLVSRSIYGFYSISTTFFYLFSFIGYQLSYCKQLSDSLKDNSENRSTVDESLKAVRVKQNEESIKDKSLSDEDRQAIEKAVSTYIDARYYLQKGVTLKSMAHQIGVSRVALSLYFQTTEYKKFNNWLMHLRIEESKKLLIAHPDWSNETVAEACGFNGRAYFQIQFSEHEGMTPFKWTKEHQNGM